MHYTYVLLSDKDGLPYTGTTGDLRYLKNRLAAFLSETGHNTLERH